MEKNDKRQGPFPSNFKRPNSSLVLPGSLTQPPPQLGEKNPWTGSIFNSLAVSEAQTCCLDSLFRWVVRPGDPRAEFTEGPGTNELLTTNWKGSVKSQHVKYEKGALCHAGGWGEKRKERPIWKEFKQPQ